MNYGVNVGVTSMEEFVVTAIPLPLPGEAVPGPVNGLPDAEPPPVQGGGGLAGRTAGRSKSPRRTGRRGRGVGSPRR